MVLTLSVLASARSSHWKLNRSQGARQDDYLRTETYKSKSTEAYSEHSTNVVPSIYRKFATLRLAAPDWARRTRTGFVAAWGDLWFSAHIWTELTYITILIFNQCQSLYFVSRPVFNRESSPNSTFEPEFEFFFRKPYGQKFKWQKSFFGSTSLVLKHEKS